MFISNDFYGYMAGIIGSMVVRIGDNDIDGGSSISTFGWFNTIFIGVRISKIGEIGDTVFERILAAHPFSARGVISTIF